MSRTPQDTSSADDFARALRAAADAVDANDEQQIRAALARVERMATVYSMTRPVAQVQAVTP